MITAFGCVRRIALAWVALTAVGCGLLTVVTGCQTPKTAAAMQQTPRLAETSKAPEMQTLREGDTLKISFPGAPNLDTTQQVRRDGRITLSIVGEMMVVGLTPGGLEKELLRVYSSQLRSKEVTVIRPGKIISDHPISALEAVMEAGGFDSAKANMKAVVVVRQEGGRTQNYTLNLKLVLEGKQNEQFFLQPSDIVYVPEKFSWF